MCTHRKEQHLTEENFLFAWQRRIWKKIIVFLFGGPYALLLSQFRMISPLQRFRAGNLLTHVRLTFFHLFPCIDWKTFFVIMWNYWFFGLHPMRLDSKCCDLELFFCFETLQKSCNEFEVSKWKSFDWISFMRRKLDKFHNRTKWKGSHLYPIRMQRCDSTLPNCHYYHRIYFFIIPSLWLHSQEPETLDREQGICSVFARSSCMLTYYQQAICDAIKIDGSWSEDGTGEHKYFIYVLHRFSQSISNSQYGIYDVDPIDSIQRESDIDLKK